MSILGFFIFFQACGAPSVPVTVPRATSEVLNVQKSQYTRTMQKDYAKAPTVQQTQGGHVQASNTTQRQSLQKYQPPQERQVVTNSSLQQTRVPELRYFPKIDVDTEIPEGDIKRPDSVAVVIGNQHYEKGLPEVKYAKQDAKVVREYLVKTMGYDHKNIIFDTDVSFVDMCNIFGTREKPEGRLHAYIHTARSDEVFIYYTGHGTPGNDGSNYLVPVDATYDYIDISGYSLDTFYKNLIKLPTKKVTVVLDACFSGYSASGPLFKDIKPAMLKCSNPTRRIEGGSVFCSSGKGQKSLEYPAKRHSLFTYFFLKGLRGEADQNNDKEITTGEMKRYLEKKVPYYALREKHIHQNPLVTGDKNALLTRLK